MVIPEKFRVKLLHHLHKDHPGICKMKKSISRSHFWWPGINKEIEEKVKSYLDCLAIKKSPSVAPLHPWEWPSRVYERLHIHCADPFQEVMLMIIIDGYSE